MQETITIKDTESNKAETIQNVIGIWNESRTVEYIEDGESVFLHLEDWEVIESK